jgi:hypothetical protein
MPGQPDAALVYDSRHGSPATGVHAAGTGFPRLTYRGNGFVIDLQVRPGSQPDRLRVLGQVLHDEYEACSGRVVIESKHGVGEVALDRCGQFSIDGLVAGRHRVELRLPHATIQIPSIDL